MPDAARNHAPAAGAGNLTLICMDASRNARTEIGVLGQADCSFVFGLFAQTFRSAGPDEICRSAPHLSPELYARIWIQV